MPPFWEIDEHKLFSLWLRGSSVGGGVRCRVHVIPGSRLGFPTQTNQSFNRSEVDELVADRER